MDGDEQALEQLTPLIYNELHAIARRHMVRERREHTLQPTALINELYLRVLDQALPSFQNRAHFFAIASQIMRQILVGFARRRLAARRDGGNRETFDEAQSPIVQHSEELLDLHAVLDRLALQDARKAKVIELRYFGGLQREEIAEVLNVSLGTVKRDLTFAEAWLQRELMQDKAKSAAAAKGSLS